MPAAAVIPAPIAYIKVVAVKKLVVGPWTWTGGPPNGDVLSGWAFPLGEPHVVSACRGTRTFTLKKLECSKQARRRNTLAWNNRIGRAVLFCWFLGIAVMINRDSRGH